MENAIVAYEQGYLAPAAQLDTILRAYQLKKEFVEKVLREGVDFGSTPGTNEKPSLKKAGAEKLANLYNLVPTFDDITVIEDWTGEAHGGEPLFYYRQRCNLWRNSPDGGRVLVGSAEGSCNSWEKKYRYRNGERVCPQCGKNTIIKGKAEYGGGFICFAKKGGCGAKFKDNDPAITGQDVGQVKNPDVPELVNTILKMAEKRSFVAAMLITTGASDYFTQDLDDFVTDAEWHEAPAQPAQPPTQAQKPAQPPAQPPAGKAPAQPANGNGQKPAPKAPEQPQAPAGPMTLERAYTATTPKNKRLVELTPEQLKTVAENASYPEDTRQAAFLLLNRPSAAQWEAWAALCEQAAAAHIEDVAEPAANTTAVELYQMGLALAAKFPK